MQASLIGDVVMVSYYSRQIKIVELPLDVYRMVQALEFELRSARSSETGSLTARSSSASERRSEGHSPPDKYRTGCPVNPTKHLIYRPRASEVVMQLSSVVERLAMDKYLVLYLDCKAISGLPPGADADPLRCALIPTPLLVSFCAVKISVLCQDTGLLMFFWDG
jgi:hypothetical protein